MFGLYSATNFLCILFLLQTYSQRIQVIYEGQNVAFYCNATGGSKNDYIHYQWEVNNRDLIATDAYFHIRGIQKSDEGEYKCIATQYVNGTPIVATESTFISVRKADSIITQDVEEGILVRILCNVSSDEKPDGAGPFRYEWRNPNGTLVGTQWKLELGHIKVHESGIYVCRVSYEFDKRQMSTSSATKINVIPRAGVIFPGIRGNVLEVLETGDILQECQVVSAKPSQYNFQWFGPDGRLISNSAFLQRDYITRQRDEGIYRCVASPVEEGRLQVENSLIVTQHDFSENIALRFQITTLEEDLNIGGFTHRRIILVDSSKPNLTTRETFIYQWLDTEMNPILDSMGPDLRINFHSPSDFGRYSVRITGLNSGYQRDLSTYITLDGRNGEVEPTYSVVIREISGPLYLNARLELECSPRPPNSAARINWLGPDGMVVSDSSNIVFERFQPHHQGRYTCQILLPNQIILRQSVELVVSGTSTEIPEPDRHYTIRIIQSPTYFRYNDAVHLQCVVSPTPPLVSYEWFKDGVLIGRQADIRIERFSPDDVGRYQCVARLDSMVLTFNSTISIDDGTGVDLIMRPNIIYIPAFHPFEIECLSIRTGLSPIAIFGNGAPIESDNRFTITKPNEQRLIIKATDGLSSVYNGLRIRCMLPGLNYKEVTLYIMDICTASQSQCRTRQCIQTSLICDGKADCLDKSDEGSSFCNAGLTVIPTRIVVKPSEPFSLKCQTILPGTRMPHARFVYSGRDVESDPRFIIERSPGILLIKAPNGLSAEANDTRIECYFPDESPRTAIINVVPDRCGLGYFMCYDGSCIQQSQRCDGQTQCPDGSDEIKCVCQPPRILCSSGECITPEMRCDGIQHCRDGSDEIACPPRCRPGQYQCSSGECIEQQMRCDGRQDCRDASDETGCPPRCRPGQYQCSSGECIEQQMRCDGRQDCRDASDETGCPPRCRPGQYQCSSGECIEQQMRCDGRQDCRDASDETGCPPRCRPGQYQCSSGECIEQQMRCDGRQDCRDASDETGCPPRCRPGQYQCSSGECIEQQMRCDGRQDCRDASDETGCPPRCRPGQYQCSSGECIEQQMRCDGRQDCRDASDETGCPPRCRPGQYQCSSGECIEQQMRCDGRQDCRDASDETGCPPRCRPGQYQCSSGECIEQQMRCDGRQDCRDASDETGCPPRCRPGQYQCSSGECIEQQMRCDGRQDCRDASDETGCPPRCRPGQYQCSSGECIEQQMRCDGRQDCRDASDETGCPPRCRPGQYQCSSGECIEQQMRCDGRQDCRDASDETGCPPRCRPGQYQCSSGECIEQQMRCDGRQDCRDASDETGCRERVNIRVVPDVIYTQPYERWKFECSVLGADVEPIVKFQDGRLVESDPNFRVTRIDPNTVSVEAIHGLTEKKERFSFICTFPGGPEEEIDVFVRRRCPHGQFMCKDGTCRSETDFCNGQVDCPDGSDERPPYCRQIIQVEIRPSIIHVQPYKPFEFECISHVPGIKPEARLSSGILVSQDPRFNVEYLSPNRLRVSAIYGLTDRDHPFQIHCIFPGLENRTTVIEIERPCPSGQFQCMDGRCLPFNLFCDGKSDCSDSSDESERYCAVNIRVTPGSIRVIPNQRFQFECSTSIPGVSPQVTFDERSVERDNRFVVTRPSLQTIVVTAPTGISDIGAHKFKCIVSVNIVKEVDVEIISECPPGQAKCRSGECLPRAVFCDGKYDCSDRSDEDPRSCVSTIIITPSTILTKPHESFQFECKSVMPGGEPQITLEGSPVENDPRFTIIRPSREHVIVRAESGIADPGKYSFTCTVVSAPSKTIVVQVESVCPPGYSKCKDGTCILSHQFCDGIAHCRDGSDEDKLRCPEVTADIRVHFTPGELRIQPGRAFRLECVTDRPGTSPVLQFIDGRPITSDQRFVVSRPSTERAIIDVPGGLDARDRQIIIECISPSGERKTSTIFIELGCQPGQRRCPSGQCIFVGQFCDGKPDCDDGFDERPENCEYCDPITKPCEIVNGISPREKTYELHWRCDGEDDCGNRFDEQNCLNDTRVPNKECGATHFRCGTAPYQYIPFAYWCDGGRDCRGGEDEADCSPPTIIQTQRQETHRVRPGGRLILECEASGVPPPMIIWRFNWRCLRDETRMRTQAVPSSLECKGSKSRLTIENFREGDDGIYNCEALTSKERAMSQDIFVFLSP
uniref:Basement membrane-specific heparan sulfate proteoglycan core protein n=1 Tax=Schistosoma mansoni TaxID=6183 RepID=A0A5K4FE25_SCHMA